MQHHPDVGGNAEHFKQIHSAYIRLISAADSLPLAGEEGSRLRVVYGTRSYASGYLVWRKLLRPRIRVDARESTGSHALGGCSGAPRCGLEY